MESDFKDYEFLLRAVWPVEKRLDFWENGRLRSAALKDERGLSVNRSFDCSLQEAIGHIRGSKLQGHIVKLTVPDCKAVDAHLEYLPSKANCYHSEIWGYENSKVLSDEQALRLARLAEIVYKSEPTVTVTTSS